MAVATVDYSSSRATVRVRPPPPAIVETMQGAVERWDEFEAPLRRLADAVESGTADDIIDFDSGSAMAPLPRAWQWLDASAFASHGALMDRVMGMAPEKSGLPLMYQGMSHQFLGPNDDVPFLSEADGIDFEGEFGVILGEVPLGVSAEDALSHVRLIVQINDWSLRAIAPIEMKTGFGWIGAKPACSMAPLAVTPDELGSMWDGGRICAELQVDLNGQRFGSANGGAMEPGFAGLIAHAARTRSLCAGTILGSGTVSNENYREIGSSCIAERRGIEVLDIGTPQTNFMRFGDRVRMDALGSDGVSLFGAIDQLVSRVPPRRSN